MTRPRRLFLHVGLPKTATTAWQVWWDDHRAALLAQGVDYPPAATVSFEPNHSAIAGAMRRGDMEPLRQVLASAKAETVLLSSESLSMTAAVFSARAIEGLRTTLEGITVTSLLVLRQPEAWLRSYHKQMLLNNVSPGPSFGLPLTLEDCANLPRVRRMLDPGAVKASVEAAFGGPCLVFQHEEAPFSALCAAVGIDPAGLPEPGQFNVSVSPAAADLMRQVNGLTSENPLRHGLIWLLAQVQPSNHNRLRNTPPPDPRLWPRIRQVLAGLSPRDGDQRALALSMQRLAAKEAP